MPSVVLRSPSSGSNGDGRYVFSGESPRLAHGYNDRMGSLSNSAFYREHCAYLPAMLGWFLFSSLLSTYNKLVFGSDHMNFPCPLLLTSMHFGTQWIFSHALCKTFPTTFGSQRVDEMSWSEFLCISIPCGLVTSGDVGLSNLALVSISITFYTMVKSSAPVFVLAWGYFFGIIQITWALVGVVLIISLGEYLTVAGEVNFVLKGFLLCLMASILSGARWTLVQLKIQRLDPPLKTTLATMRILSPFMFISMVLVSAALEKPWNKLDGYIESRETIYKILGLGFGGAFLAIFMILCEFYLIMYSNAVVLMIGGVIKEILTIFIG
jgi:solute carrier family 35, member C2